MNIKLLSILSILLFCLSLVYSIDANDDAYYCNVGEILIVEPSGIFSGGRWECTNLQEYYLNDYLPLSGGTMQGDIDMGGHNIINATWINATKINTTEYYSENIYTDSINSYSEGDIFINNNLNGIYDLTTTGDIYGDKLQGTYLHLQDGIETFQVNYNALSGYWTIYPSQALYISENLFVSNIYASQIFQFLTPLDSQIDFSTIGTNTGQLKWMEDEDYFEMEGGLWLPMNNAGDKGFAIGDAAPSTQQGVEGLFTSWDSNERSVVNNWKAFIFTARENTASDMNLDIYGVLGQAQLNGAGNQGAIRNLLRSNIHTSGTGDLDEISHLILGFPETSMFASGYSGYVDEAIGLWVTGLDASGITGGGSVTNQYGILIEDVKGADEDNYAIVTGLGEVHFGDKLYVEDSIEYNGTLITHSPFISCGADENKCYAIDYETETATWCSKDDKEKWICDTYNENIIDKLNSADNKKILKEEYINADRSCVDDYHTFISFEEYKGGARGCILDYDKARFLCEEESYQFWVSETNECYENVIVKCMMNNTAEWIDGECVGSPELACETQRGMIWENNECVYSAEKDCSMKNPIRYIWNNKTNTCVDVLSINDVAVRR